MPWVENILQRERTIEARNFGGMRTQEGFRWIPKPATKSPLAQPNKKATATFENGTTVA